MASDADRIRLAIVSFSFFPSSHMARSLTGNYLFLLQALVALKFKPPDLSFACQ